MSTGGGALLGESVLVLRTDQAPLNRGLAEARVSTERTGAQMQASMDRRMVSMGQSMSRVGSTLTRSVTLPLAASAAVTVKAAMDFDRAMTLIRTQAGASAKEVAYMRGEILKLAPSLGQTPTALANALFHIESGGFHASKALDILRQSAKLASIGNADLETTTNAVVAIMRSAPKDVHTATQAIGLLNATVGAGNMRLQDLTAALSTGIVPAAKAAGLGFRDVGAALDVMTSRGVPAQDAATRLRMTISLLSAPTSTAAKALASVGINSTQLAEDMRKPDGLVRAVEDLKSHMHAAGLSAVQQNQLIAHAFGGGRSSSAILTLIQNVSDLQRHFQEIGQHSGAAQVAKEWKTTQHDLAFRWDQMKSDAEKAAIQIGSKLGPDLLHLGKEVADDAAKLASAFASLPPGLQHAIITGGLLSAGVGPILQAVGALAKVSGGLFKAARLFGNLTGFGGGKSIAGSSTVATMEVAEMIVKSMIGGGSGGVPTSPSNAAKTAEQDTARTIEQDAIKAGETGAEAGGGMAVFQALKSLGIRGLTSAYAPAGAFAAGASLPFASAALVRALGGGAVSTPKMLAALGLTRMPIVGTGRTAASSGGQVSKTSATVAQMQKDAMAASAALSKLEKHKAGVDQTAAALLALAAKASKAGDEASGFADTFGAGMLKSHDVTSKYVIGMISALNRLPPATGKSAAEAMLRMSRTLESQGRLPLGSTIRLVDEMLAHYKGMRDLSSQDFQQLAQYAGHTMDQLRQKIATSTGAQRAAWIRQYDQLEAQISDTLSRLASDVNVKLSDIKGTVTQESALTATQGNANFKKFASTVYDYMGTGAISAGAGARMIVSELNKVLGQLGQKKLTPVQVGQFSIAADISSGVTPLFDRGGLMQIGRPGEAGRDSVPLDVGGTPIVVAPGEQVAVFNRHQLPIVNAALAAYGGLPGLFERVSKPNYMAQGGVVAPGYAQGGTPGGGSPRSGGYVYPLPAGAAIGRTDEGVDASMPVGAPIGPIGPARVEGISPNWYRGQPYMWWQLLSGPDAGRYVYLAEQITPLARPGQKVAANQAIARFAPSGTGIEMGWGTQTAGVTLAKATTGYTEGQVTPAGLAFRAFLEGLAHGKILGGGIAAKVWSALSAPSVQGSGGYAELIRAGLQRVTSAANKYGRTQVGKWDRAHVGSTTAGAAGITSTRGGKIAFSGPVSTFGPPLEGASSTASGQSDAIPGLSLRIPGTSWDDPRNRALMGHMFRLSLQGHSGVFPDIDLGPADWTGRNIDVTGAAASRIGIDPRSFPTGAIGSVQELAKGGLLGALQYLASGGTPHHHQHGHHPHRHAHPPAHHHHRRHHGQRRGSSPGDPGASGGETRITSDYEQLKQLLDPGSTDKSGVPWLTELLGYWPGIWQIRNPTAYGIMSDPSQAIISTDPQTGAPVLPYLDTKDVAIARAWLQQQIGWETTIVHDIQAAAAISSRLQREGRQEIRKRKREIDRIKKRIQHNLKRIRDLQRKIADTNKWIGRTQKLMGNVPTGSGPSQGLGATKADTAKILHYRHHIADLRKRIHGWREEIHTLNHENVRLGGRGMAGATSVSSATGGRIGHLDQEIKPLSNIMTAVADPSGQYSPDQLLGLTGHGGQLAQEDTNLRTLRSELEALSPKNLARLLADAKAQASPQSAQELPSLLLQQEQTLREQLAVSQAQYATLAGMLPPFGGSFATGGVVPGMLGEPRTIIAHGGERVTPPGDGTSVRVRVEDHRVRVWVDEVERIVDRRTRHMARQAGRPLPGRGGGL